MGVSSRGGLLGFVARLGGPSADSDAALLERYVRYADAEAFAGIVRRHGPMVLAVCRRRLGREADAEDAFQAVFLVLARKAGSIGRREALPGWLYRVAHLIALKAAARQARHPLAPLRAAEVAMPEPTTPACETADLGAVLDTELAGLPDRLRAVAVLRLVEGRTAAEAAAMLGVPVGTVDSRLNAARAKLQARLTRRGVALGVSIAFEQTLGIPRATAGPEFERLAEFTTRTILAEVTGAGAVSPAVADLAHGVTLMTTTRLRFWAALGVAVGLLGGAGLYLAAAERPAAKAASDGPAAAGADTQQQPKKGEPTPAADTDPLQKRFPKALDGGGIVMDDLFRMIEDETDMVIRVDVAAFRRLHASGSDEGGLAAEFLNAIYQTKAILPRRADRMMIREVLGDALAQAPYPCTFQVRGNQIVIVPAYQPPVRPGLNPLDLPPDDEVAVLPLNVLYEQIHGPPVNVSVERKPLPEILADLRKQTGANIVLDPRCEADGKLSALTVSLTDVRLYDALRVIADLAGLKMVYAGNVYYVTTRQNAAMFQPPTPRTPPSPGSPDGK